jgi:hypothetical protein
MKLNTIFTEIRLHLHLHAGTWRSYGGQNSALSFLVTGAIYDSVKYTAATTMKVEQH